MVLALLVVILVNTSGLLWLLLLVYMSVHVLLIVHLRLCHLLLAMTTSVNQVVLDSFKGNVTCIDPLWDGKQCGLQEEACCLISGLPWFHKKLVYCSTTDYIEMRIYGDEPVSDEDCPVAYYELYVK